MKSQLSVSGPSITYAHGGRLTSSAWTPSPFPVLLVSFTPPSSAAQLLDSLCRPEAIALARECDVPEILPAAFYALSLQRFGYNADGGRSHVVLSQADMRRLIIGPEEGGLFTLFAIAFLLIGISLFGIGLLGEYVGRIYQEVRRRPRYVVAAVLGGRHEEKS